MTTEPYVPNEQEIIEGSFVSEDEARRGIARIKAESWAEGYEAGCSSPYGTATPSGKPYDPEPNPYRIEEEA